MKLATFGTEVERVPVAKIRVDGGTQMRAGLNAETVADYAADMLTYGGWGEFKPIEVYHDGATYWLADGFHRVAAAKEAGVELADAKIHAGDQRKAILHAAGANSDHGLRRTNADKRRAVETFLRDAEWRDMTDVEIAKTCKVDSKTVGNIRRELTATLEIPMSPTRKTADGRTMNTTNIGRKEQQQYASVWQLEGKIKFWLESAIGAVDPDAVLDALKTQSADPNMRGGWLTPLCQSLTEAEIAWRKSDLSQAINNVREQRRQAQLRTSGEVVYLEGAEIPADLVAAGAKFTRNGPSWQYIVPGDGETTTRLAPSLREAVAAVRLLLAARPEPTPTEQPEYAPYWRLLGSMRHWTDSLVSQGDSPMLALAVLKKGGGTASYRHSLVEHLRVAGVVYRENDLSRAIDELHQWHGRLRDAKLGQVETVLEVVPAHQDEGEEAFHWQQAEGEKAEHYETHHEERPEYNRWDGEGQAEAAEGNAPDLEPTPEQARWLKEYEASLPTPDELAAMAEVASELADEDQERAAREATRLPAENAPEPRALIDPFEAWLNAMPSNLNLRECAVILDVAKTTAKHALELKPSLYNAVYGALPTWSHLIREVGKAAGR